MGPDDNIKKTARTRDNFSTYEQKNIITTTATVFTVVVCNVGIYTCFYYNIYIYIYCRSCDAYTRRIIVFILPCAAYSAVDDPLFSCRCIHIVLLQYVERKKIYSHMVCTYDVHIFMYNTL